MAVFDIQSIIHGDNEMQFSWTDVGEKYLVYRDNKRVYEGTDTRFRTHQVNDGKLISYSIESVINDEIVDVIRLQTSFLLKHKNLENPLQYLVMTTIVCHSKIVLTWESIQGVTRYEIYKNDAFLGVVEETTFIDREIDRHKEITYRIQAQRHVVQSEVLLNRSKAIVTNIIGKATVSLSHPSIEEFRLVKKVQAPNKLLVPTTQREELRVSQWRFRYTTFIKEQTIKNPNKLSRYATFGGDGRNFRPNASNYRTRVDVSLNYNEKNSPMICEKRVGKTIGYNRHGKIHQVGVAKYDGISFKRYDHQVGDSGFLIKHDVQNPLIQAPKLNYEVWAALGNDGEIDMTGFHNQAPHHEVYLQKEKGDWTAVYLAESKGLVRLSDLTSWKYWRYSTMES